MREKWAAMESHDQVFFVQIKGGRVGDTGEFGRLMLAPSLTVLDSWGAGNHPAQSAFSAYGVEVSAVFHERKRHGIWLSGIEFGGGQLKNLQWSLLPLPLRSGILRIVPDRFELNGRVSVIVCT